MMTRLPSLVGLLLTAFAASLLVGCGGGGGGDAGDCASPVASAPRRNGSLQYTVSVPRGCFARGENIPISLSVQNVGSDPVVIAQRSGGLPADAEAVQGGQQVWQYSRYTVVAQAGGALQPPLQIAAGQTQTFNITWDTRNHIDLPGAPFGQAAPAGSYSVRAWLTPAAINGTPVTLQDASANLTSDPIQITIQ